MSLFFIRIYLAKRNIVVVVVPGCPALFGAVWWAGPLVAREQPAVASSQAPAQQDEYILKFCGHENGK